MSNVVRGRWLRGANGVEIVDKGPPYMMQAAVFAFAEDGRFAADIPIWGVNVDAPRDENGALTSEDYPAGVGLFLRYRGGMAPAQMVERELDDLRAPLVVDFANAKSKAALLAFLDSYGLPLYPGQDVSSETMVPLHDVLDDQALFRATLTMGRAGNLEPAGRLFGILAGYFAVGRPQILISPDKRTLRQALLLESLYGFMCWELATVLTGGARLMVCDHCGKFFMSGTDTGRRHRHSVAYCSNRCRVAAQRKRDREGRESGGKRAAL